MIPLGTDGAWTYGGLTSPPSTPPTPTPTLTATATPSLSSSSIPSITSFSSPSDSSSSSITSTQSSVTSSSPLPSPTANGSRGISAAVLGAILGSVLGFLLLVLLAFIIFLLCRHKRRRGPDGQSSSFWNRSTTVPGDEANRATPIWTGWEIVEPGASRTHAEEGPRTPGEGSPRGSGEEADPFLTRRSIHSGTVADEMAQTKTGTDTLVSLPAAAVVGGGATRSSPPRAGGHIVPPDVLNRMMSDYEEENTPPPGIRLVEPSPPAAEYSPLLPPPRLDPDGLNTTDLRPPRGSAGSLHSHAQSIGSQKSLGSFEFDPQEGAELLTARRVRVGEPGTPRTISTLPSTDPEAGTSPSRNTLGLNNLGGRLGRLSWFRRMSSAGPAAHSDSQLVIPAVDPYTRTPPRSHSRRDSRSRPSSWRPLSADAETEHATTPTGNRNSQRESGLGFGLNASRPISSVSARSGTSGNTVYHDALSTPASDNFDVPSTVAVAGTPMVTTFSESQGSSSTPRAGGGGAYSSVPTDPPPYESDSTRSDPTEVDILDIPAPSPASPFSSSRPAFPPGLVALPTPRTWRDSYSSNNSPVTASSSTGIDIDVLEDEPPRAQQGWRSLAGGAGEGGIRDGRRTTFGTPVVVHQQSHTSDEASLHSMRSHLSPNASRSPAGSAPASHHTLTGSNSSRPSAHSHSRTGSSGLSLSHSSSVSDFDRRRARRGTSDAGEVASPPLSAVFGGRSGRGSMGMTGSPPSSRPASPLSPLSPRSLVPHSIMHDVSPSSSRTPLLAGDAQDGTVRSSTRTNDTNTNSSMTTALTDPITGAVLHFPSLPWRSTLERDRERSWPEGPGPDDMW
ncbi:unnamed protein product [Somion occarium]|uniref:Uncharacterized protein n=1 Tax=Somion occarium TaxID=3059160 RepID=A0ABP1E6U8_9APHY